MIIGGTGLVGRATARRLVLAGWTVTVTGRDPGHLPADLAALGVTFQVADRDDGASVAAVAGSGADLLVDCICYTATQARLLLPVLPSVTSTVLISSKAVYVDDHGNHSNSETRPDYGGPVSEAQPTMAAGDMDYRSRNGYGANKVAAEQVLLDSGAPVTVLRPSKIHGEGALVPREWWFVRRILQGRPVVLLAHGGRGTDHPSAAVNIAGLVETVAHRPGRRILNSADPDAPSGLDIARVIAAHLGHRWREVLLGEHAPAGLGRHPWDSVPPVVLDTSVARALGWTPLGTYAETVVDELDWLTSAGGDLPAGCDEEYFDGRFDYAAEDAYVATAE